MLRSSLSFVSIPEPPLTQWSTCFRTGQGVQRAGAWNDVQGVPAGQRILEKDTTSSAEDDLPLTGSETILLAEDNTDVRLLTTAFLKRSGYEVLIASSGEDALEIATEHKDAIHMLLTDVVMPGMNGRVLHLELFKLHPEIRALYMTGYTNNIIAHHGVLEKGIQFIQKPFSLKVLARKIRETLQMKI